LPTDKVWLAFLGDVKRFVQNSAPAAQPNAPTLQSLVQLQPALPGARNGLRFGIYGVAEIR
jgi:hypothetical protein